MQSKVGNLLAALVPRARIVPGVDPKDMSQDPAVVRQGFATVHESFAISDKRKEPQHRLPNIAESMSALPLRRGAVDSAPVQDLRYKSITMLTPFTLGSR